jgi:hypothetical protein
MTIGAYDLAFSHFHKHLRPRPGVLDELRDIRHLAANYMVEVQDDNVYFTAIDARVFQ